MKSPPPPLLLEILNTPLYGRELDKNNLHYHLIYYSIQWKDKRINLYNYYDTYIKFVLGLKDNVPFIILLMAVFCYKKCNVLIQTCTTWIEVF